MGLTKTMSLIKYDHDFPEKIDDYLFESARIDGHVIEVLEEKLRGVSDLKLYFDLKIEAGTKMSYQEEELIKRVLSYCSALQINASVVKYDVETQGTIEIRICNDVKLPTLVPFEAQLERINQMSIYGIDGRYKNFPSKSKKESVTKLGEGPDRYGDYRW